MTYLITYITLDGNVQCESVYASTEYLARRQFEQDYCFEEIVSVELESN